MVEKEDLTKFVEFCIKKDFEIEVKINDLKLILINEFNRKDLQYPFGKHYLKTFSESLEYNNFGKFNENRQVFVFNQENPIFIKGLMQKVKTEKKSETS
jgi:hypothetical protein